MAEHPTITEAEARAECLRVGINPDDWHEPPGGPRTYAWQLVRAHVERKRRDNAILGLANKET